jgi:hypothetical protein
VGCLTAIVLPIAALILVITLIGIPVAILVVLGGAIAGYFGWLCVGFLVGERILHALNARQITPIFAIVVGIVLLALIGAMPIVGGLVKFVVAMLGLGAVILTRFGTRPYPLGPSLGLPPAGALPLAPLPPLAPDVPSARPSAPDIAPASSGPASTVVPAAPVSEMPSGLAAAPVTPPTDVVPPEPVSQTDTPPAPSALGAEPFPLAHLSSAKADQPPAPAVDPQPTPTADRTPTSPDAPSA